jgi:hypothetical protein
MEDRELQTLDLDTVIDEASEHAAALFERAGK